MPEWSFTLEHLQKFAVGFAVPVGDSSLQIFVVVLWDLSFSGHKNRVSRFVHRLQIPGCFKFQRGRIIWGGFPQIFLSMRIFYALLCEHCLLNNADQFSESTSGIFVLKKTTCTCSKSSFWRWVLVKAIWLCSGGSSSVQDSQCSSVLAPEFPPHSLRAALALTGGRCCSCAHTWKRALKSFANILMVHEILLHSQSRNL